MATVITISPSGEVKITTEGDPPATEPEEKPATVGNLVRLFNALAGQHGITNQKVDVLTEKVNAIYQIVSGGVGLPDSMSVHWSAPEQET